MQRKLLRMVGFSLAMVGCTTETVLVAPRGIPLKKNQAVTPQKEVAGAISATVTFFQPDTWITYKTREIPIRARVESGRIKIDEAATQAMLASVYVAGQGKRIHNASLPGNDDQKRFQLAAYSSDPEQDLVNWANANQSKAGPEDDFLETPPWGELTSAYYTEDVSAEHNGSAMLQMYLDPISTANPNGQIRMYLNGHPMGEVNPQYQYSAADGGYALNVENATAYRYAGSTSAGGSRQITMPQQTRHQIQPVQPWLRFAASACHPLKAAGEQFLNSLLPTVAQAQGVGCNYYMREMAIGVGGMVVSGILANPLGFFVSMIAVANRLHAYARCKESTK